jgi:hypothetical protein
MVTSCPIWFTPEEKAFSNLLIKSWICSTVCQEMVEKKILPAIPGIEPWSSSI